MVEFVKLDKTPQKVISNKQRTQLIIFTYILNFLLYVILFDRYNNFLLKYWTLILIVGFASQMLAGQTSLSSINGWTIIYTIINGFVFGFTSMMFSYNLIIVVINLLYFKYVVSRLELKKQH